MYEHVMVETLSVAFNAISVGGGGGNVYNVMLHVNAATLRGLTSLIQFQKIIVYGGRGVYSQLKAK